MLGCWIVFEGEQGGPLHLQLAREPRLHAPRAASSPAIANRRFLTPPKTDTYTRASCRSGETETPVTVTIPIRGSWRPDDRLGDDRRERIRSRGASGRSRPCTPIGSDSQRHHLCIPPGPGMTADRRPQSSGETSVRSERTSSHSWPESHCSARSASSSAARASRATNAAVRAAALPELVMGYLGHRGAEAILELRFRRKDVLALSLERPRLGKVQLNREYRDVTGNYGFAAAQLRLRVLRSGSGSARRARSARSRASRRPRRHRLRAGR